VGLGSVDIEVRYIEIFRSLFLKRPTTLIGLILVLVILLCAVFAGILTASTPHEINVDSRLLAPNSNNLMGTDEFGRDVFTRVLYGARNTLFVALFVVVLAVGLGLLFGLIAGYYPKLDSPVMRVMDGLMAFPGIILAIAMMGAMGPSILNVIVALGIVYTPRVTRVVRSYILSLRESQFVEAARSIGTTSFGIVFEHILPNCISPLIVQASFIFSYAILGETALSFLGVGVPVSLPSWGNILSEGRVYMQVAPWLTLFPGLAIMIMVLGLNIIGDGLRDYLDPRMKGK